MTTEEQKRAELAKILLTGVSTDALEQITKYYTLPQLLRQDIEYFDFCADNLYVRDIFSRFVIELAGGFDNLDIDRGSYSDPEL